MVAATLGLSIWMAMPVGMSCDSPGISVIAWSMQARKSKPADSAVAYSGSGNSVPIRGSKIFNLIGSDMVVSLIDVECKDYPFFELLSSGAKKPLRAT